MNERYFNKKIENNASSNDFTINLFSFKILMKKLQSLLTNQYKVFLAQNLKELEIELLKIYFLFSQLKTVQYCRKN